MIRFLSSRIPSVAFTLVIGVGAGTIFASAIGASSIADAQRPVEPYPLGMHSDDMEILGGFWRMRGSRNTLLQVVASDKNNVSHWTANIYVFDRKAGRWNITESKALAWVDGKLEIAFVQSKSLPAILRIAAFRETNPLGYRIILKAAFLNEAGSILKVTSEADLFRY